MRIDPTPFTKLAFDSEPLQPMPGEACAPAMYRQLDAPGIRMRTVDYPAGFVMDHWCDVGHFAYVLAGEITIEFTSKAPCRLQAGEGFIVSTDGDASHRVVTAVGAKVLLLD